MTATESIYGLNKIYCNNNPLIAVMRFVLKIQKYWVKTFRKTKNSEILSLIKIKI